jgi:uncharacterized cupredoxin-like copper-binding protein
MRRAVILLTVAGLVAFTLAACAGGSSLSKSIHVTMTDFAFSPNAFAVPAGEDISLEVTNNGAVAHSFIIMKAGQQVEGHFTDADKANVYWEVTAVPPGESVKSSFTSPSDAGQYQVVCGVAGHLEAGMVAKLTVVKGQ